MAYTVFDGICIPVIDSYGATAATGATDAKVLSLWHRHTMGSKQAPGGAATHVTHGGLTASQRSQGLFFQGGLSPQGWARAAACL